METERIGRIIVGDYKAAHTLDRGTDYRVAAYRLPLKKYEIITGEGYLYAIHKGKEVDHEEISGATPCDSGHAILRTINRKGGKVFHLFGAYGKWLKITTLFDRKDKVIGFHIWLEDLSES